jgi:3-oxoacyl-[acyl-carrier protein] reductase
MADSGFGRIVNICSIQGLMGASLSSTYSASKHALVGYTKSVAIEWGSSGVTCNALCPGYIGTPMTGSGIAHPEEAIDVHRIPARRLGSTIEIAELVAFLIGRDASYINGSTFVIDGGILAGMDTIMPAG